MGNTLIGYDGEYLALETGTVRHGHGTQDYNMITRPTHGQDWLSFKGIWDENEFKEGVLTTEFATYVGNFRQGKLHGQGEIVIGWGHYFGCVRKNVSHGHGVIMFGAEYKYEGDFVKGVSHSGEMIRLTDGKRGVKPFEQTGLMVSSTREYVEKWFN